MAAPLALFRSTLSTSEADLEQATEAVSKHLAEALPDQTERDLFLLAFVEALNNAAEHGNDWDPRKQIRLAGHFGPGLAMLLVEDDGLGFSPAFPDLTKVEGKRGRGLGFIRQFSDALWFNPEGNQIVFWKGCPGMFQEYKFSTARVSTLPGKVVVVSDFTPRGSVFEAIGELLDHLHQTGWEKLFLNLSNVKLITSAVWGSIFAEAGREGAKQLVMFNCSASVVVAAEAMGIKTRQDVYAKIVVAPDCHEPFLLLCQSLEQAE